MIERFYLKNYLSFKEIELNMSSGLIVFTGPSGSGKSILMNSILSSLGASSCEAALCESSVTWDISNDNNGLQNDEINIFKFIKKEKSRYFINNQSVSKKSINHVTSNYLRHLSLKDFSDFENENLLGIIDERIEKKQAGILKLKNEYKNIFLEHKAIETELKNTQEAEKKIIELKEFTTFEIKKIEDINPIISEDNELLEIKKELSKKEKVLEKIESVNAVFEYEHQIFSLLENLDIDSSFFDDSMNELRAILDTAQNKFSALDEINIEDVLNRLEELSGLKRRYGSIEEALNYKEKKKLELKKFENIEFTKNKLEEKFNKLTCKIELLANKISLLRNKELKKFEIDLNIYLKELYLRDANVILESTDYNLAGSDIISLQLNSTQLQKVSTGEFNRLRLAILALKSEFMNQNGGVLMLDEIDANLSGEESMSVAKVLRKLSKYFQIFVISHQPQLTSMGDQHFLIYKDSNISKVKELTTNEKINEIARIISGTDISNEAKQFAKELLEANKCVS